MKSIRQFFILFLVVGLNCFSQESNERAENKVNSLNKIFTEQSTDLALSASQITALYDLYDYEGQVAETALKEGAEKSDIKGIYKAFKRKIDLILTDEQLAVKKAKAKKKRTKNRVKLK